MSNQNAIEQLIRVYRCIRAIHGHCVEIYVFGSCKENPSNANDIDLLIIVNEGCDINRVKLDIEEESYPWPIDGVYMSRKEEKELEFKNTTKAIKLEDYIQQQHELGLGKNVPLRFAVFPSRLC